MHLRVTGQRALFAHLLKGRPVEHGSLPFITWEVNGGIPLGSRRNLESLEELLDRTSVDDLVLFPLDLTTGDPLEVPVDPSLTCYEAELSDGALLYITSDPFSIFSNPAMAFWVPLSTSVLRFESCGDELAITGVNKRRVVKVGADGWDSSVAIGNTNLSNDELCKWTFRVTSVAAENAAPHVPGSSMFNFNGCTFEDLRTKRTARERLASVEISQGAPQDQSTNGDPAAESTTTRSSSVSGAARSAAARDLHPIRGEGSFAFPTVLLGVADDSIPLNDSKMFASYQRCFMLDAATGAFYTAGDKRPTYVDLNNYRAFHGMTITFMLETERGVLNVVVNGQHVLAANVTKYLAASLFPVVELHSCGAIVDIM